MLEQVETNRFKRVDLVFFFFRSTQQEVCFNRLNWSIFFLTLLLQGLKRKKNEKNHINQSGCSRIDDQNCIQATDYAIVYLVAKVRRGGGRSSITTARYATRFQLLQMWWLATYTDRLLHVAIFRLIYSLTFAHNWLCTRCQRVCRVGRQHGRRLAMTSNGRRTRKKKLEIFYFF